LEQKSSRKKKADQKRKSFPNETAILKNTNNTEKPSHGRKQNTTAFLLGSLILGVYLVNEFWDNTSPKVLFLLRVVY